MFEHITLVPYESTFHWIMQSPVERRLYIASQVQKEYFGVTWVNQTPLCQATLFDVECDFKCPQYWNVAWKHHLCLSITQHPHHFHGYIIWSSIVVLRFLLSSLHGFDKLIGDISCFLICWKFILPLLLNVFCFNLISLFNVFFLFPIYYWFDGCLMGFLFVLLNRIKPKLMLLD